MTTNAPIPTPSQLDLAEHTVTYRIRAEAIERKILKTPKLVTAYEMLFLAHWMAAMSLKTLVELESVQASQVLKNETGME